MFTKVILENFISDHKVYTYKSRGEQQNYSAVFCNLKEFFFIIIKSFIYKIYDRLYWEIDLWQSNYHCF